MAVCKVCKSRFLSHSKHVLCNVCGNKYHLNCISLVPEEQYLISNNASVWMCKECHQSIFPFNWLDDEEFTTMINDNERQLNNLYDTDEDMFKIFDNVEDNMALPTYDLDPDLNFYQDYVPNLNLNCRYFTEGSFNSAYDQMNRKNVTNAVSLCHINIRSIAKNLKHFEYFLAGLKHDFTFIGITETWLTNYNDDLYTLTGYNNVGKHRQDRKGGGVALYIKDHLTFKERSDLSIFNEEIETYFIELNRCELGIGKNVIIGVLYKPPNTDIEIFNEHLNQIMYTIKQERKLAYIMGDYNINLLNHEAHAPTAAFLNMIYSNGFIPLITRPTRSTTRTKTLIDNILTNNI